MAMTGSNTQTSTKVKNTSCKMYIHHSRLHGNNFNYLNELNNAQPLIQKHTDRLRKLIPAHIIYIALKTIQQKGKYINQEQEKDLAAMLQNRNKRKILTAQVHLAKTHFNKLRIGEFLYIRQCTLTYMLKNRINNNCT